LWQSQEDQEEEHPSRAQPHHIGSPRPAGRVPASCMQLCLCLLLLAGM
jgi:hypothetical protein